MRFRSAFLLGAAAVTACAVGAGEPRPDSVPSPLAIKIGVYSPKATAPVELAGLFTSEPLVAAAWDGRPVYKLAESIVESADRRQLTVTLRRGVRFHTGAAITAPVVRDLLGRKIGRLAPEIASVAALDDRRLLLTLHKPSSVKAEDLSSLIVDNGDADGLALRTGPFKLTSTDPVVLEPFAEYYQGKPSLERIEIRRYPTPRAAWTGMMRHEVNVLHEVSRDAIEFVEAGGDIRAYPLLRPYYTGLVFNMRHATLRRREVRLAINEAIDREELVRNGMRGHGRIAEGPFWPYHWAYPHGRFPVSFNPEAAKLRLDGAGLKVGVRSSEQMRARFSFSCLTIADERFERIALLVQRQLYAIGIDMKIVPLTAPLLGARLDRGDFDAVLLEAVSGRILNWAYRLWHSPVVGSSRPFPTRYVAANAALDHLQVARSDDQVREALADVMHVMRNDPPAAFLTWPREARAADTGFEIPYETDRDIFGTLWQLKRRASTQTERR
jgi:ABC-type transport system substrate-binding protein